jgi:hypothetical protein
MKKRIVTFIFALCGVFIFQFCKLKKEQAGNKEVLFPVYNDPAYVFPKRHPVHIDSAFVSGNILNLKVNYSGGCKKHFFQLNTNGAFSKSMPVQLPLYLDDTVKTDNCREFKEELIKFDIGKLKHPSEKKIILKLTDGHAITYSY